MEFKIRWDISAIVGLMLAVIPTDTPYMDDILNAWEVFPDGTVYDYAFISVDNSYGKLDYNKN